MKCDIQIRKRGCLILPLHDCYPEEKAHEKKVSPANSSQQPNQNHDDLKMHALRASDVLPLPACTCWRHPARTPNDPSSFKQLSHLSPSKIYSSKYKILNLKTNIQAQDFPPPHLYLRSFMRGFFTCIYTRKKNYQFAEVNPHV